MKLEQGKGYWALVTGASSGIGREFCVQLAAAGMHVAMVARREKLLKDLAEQLTSTYPVQTLVIPVDLSAPGAVVQVKDRLDQRGLKVRLLCNNAAINQWGRFEKAPIETYEEMIRLNITAMVTLCRQLLPALRSHPTSAIINLSSQAAYLPMPFMSVYAASKAFVHSFSQALYGEWKDYGVLVQTVVPGPTATDFETKAGSYECGVGKKRGSPEKLVRVVLAHLGEADNPVIILDKETYTYRLFAGIAPPKMVIKKLAKIFRPPEKT